MLENLRQVTLIQSTESSNRIEGIVADDKRLRAKDGVPNGARPTKNGVISDGLLLCFWQSLPYFYALGCAVEPGNALTTANDGSLMPVHLGDYEAVKERLTARNLQIPGKYIL